MRRANIVFYSGSDIAFSIIQSPLVKKKKKKKTRQEKRANSSLLRTVQQIEKDLENDTFHLPQNMFVKGKQATKF